MKNTKIINVSALEDSFILVKHEYGKSDKPKIKIGHISNQIKENISLSVSRSSDVFPYYLKEYQEDDISKELTLKKNSA